MNKGEASCGQGNKKSAHIGALDQKVFKLGLIAMLHALFSSLRA